MSKNQILVLGLFVFIGLGIGLFFLPKSVVDNNRKLETSEEISSPEKESEKIESSHSTDAITEKEIATIKQSISNEKDKKKISGYLEVLGNTFLKSNRFDSAGHYFELAAKDKPDKKDLIYKAGSAYFEGIAFTNNPSKTDQLSEKARTLLSQVDEKNPNSVEAQAKIAMTWVNSEAPMKGILRLRELAEAHPQNEYIAFQLGMLSFQSGQYEKAIGRFETVLEINSKNVNACFYLAQSLIQTGKSKEALPWVEKGISMAKEDDTKASFLELKKQLNGN